MVFAAAKSCTSWERGTSNSEHNRCHPEPVEGSSSERGRFLDKSKMDSRLLSELGMTGLENGTVVKNIHKQERTTA